MGRCGDFNGCGSPCGGVPCGIPFGGFGCGMPYGGGYNNFNNGFGNGWQDDTASNSFNVNNSNVTGNKKTIYYENEECINACTNNACGNQICSKNAGWNGGCAAGGQGWNGCGAAAFPPAFAPVPLAQQAFRAPGAKLARTMGY